MGTTRAPRDTGSCFAPAAAPEPLGQTAGLAAVVGLWHEDLGDPFQASELLRAHLLQHLLCLEHTGYIAWCWGSWLLVFRVRGYIRRFNLYWYHLSLMSFSRENYYRKGTYFKKHIGCINLKLKLSKRITII